MRRLLLIPCFVVTTLIAANQTFAQDNTLDTGLSDFSALQTTGAPEPKSATEHFDHARRFMASNQSRSAIKALSKALPLAAGAEQRATIYRQRGELYIESNDFRRALDDFDRAAELQADNADANYQRGRALLQLAAEEFAAGIETAGQSLAEAVAAFDRAIELRSDFADALADRGGARADLGEIDEAIDDLAKANSLRDDPKFQYRLAVLYLQRAAGSRVETGDVDPQRPTDLQSAITLLTTALDPSMPELEPAAEDVVDNNQMLLTRAVARVELAALSPAAEREPLYRAALADSTSVIDDSPRLAAARYQRGVASRLLEDNRAAVRAFTEAIRLAPENTEARIRRGIAWFYLNEFDLAINDFHAVGLVPGDARPMFWTGVIHAQRGDHLEAIRAYTEAIRENRGYRLAYNNRALSLMHLGHWQRAIDDFNEMIQLNPDDAQAFQRRALAQQHQGHR